MATVSELFTNTSQAIELLRGLKTAPDPEVVERYPELVALTVRRDGQQVAWEHATTTGETSLPLLDHAVRALRKLAAIERNDIGGFQSQPILSPAEFETLVTDAHGLREGSILTLVRTALMFLDFAKGGTTVERTQWEELGADLTVHNEAAAQILVANRVLKRDAFYWNEPLLAEAVARMIAVHGYAGQWARGETPLEAFVPWVDFLRQQAPQLAPRWNLDAATTIDRLADALHLVDVCDTAAVREGLMTDTLLAELRSVREKCAAAAASADDGGLLETRGLKARFRRLRGQSRAAGEPLDRIDDAVDLLETESRKLLEDLVPHMQLWYFEPASHALSSETALKLLCLGLGRAVAEPTVDTDRMFHLSFQAMVDALGAPTREASYRVRLVETLLRDRSADELLAGSEVPGNVLGSFLARIGGTAAVALDLETTREAEALVTLLAIYESRSAVAFHQILKLLCDAYGLRKDEFDRLANEAEYLATMNQARSDKDRMLDYVQSGTIAEIGPGGGVVLDLLEARFPNSDIVGVDSSSAVVAELERRSSGGRRRWRVIEGDAFGLPQIFEPGTVDSVIFCSVLHEIYSYVEWQGHRFQLGAVRSMLHAAYEVLRPGGRIVIRDGIRPPAGTRVLKFLDPDGPDFLRRFADEFEGRSIDVGWLGPDTARMSAPDAMEFLYCYTWGPASFPYEVREQYGIMERDEYERRVLEWLSDYDPPAVAVEVPDDLRSYLQPGYRRALSDKVELTDGAGKSVALPDSNAIIVFEKPK